MELRNKLFAGLAFFSLLLAGCNSDGSSSGEWSNPPVSEETYTITWKNFDGSVLETDANVAYGSTPTYDGTTPTKGGTAQYTYTFTGWSPEVTTVTGDKTYTAQFSDSVNSYTVTWKNWDGSVLETDANVAYGSAPSYDGATPTRGNTDGFSYTFSGWSPSLSIVRNDATYTATYSKIKIGVNLTITYSLYNPKTNRLIKTYTNKPNDIGNVSVSGTYDFNTYVDLFADPNEGYTFDGWYYEGLILSSDHNYKYMMWDQDITLEARFKYTTYSLHIFANHNENGFIMIKNGNYNTYVSEDTTNQYYTESVTIAAYSKNDTRFLGWYDKDNNLISTNAVYTFNMSNSNTDIEAKWNYFTITYNLNGGTQNDSNPTNYNIDSGNLSLANPTKAGYTFMGWQYNGMNVTSVDPNWAKDVTLNALWNDGNEYVVALDADGGEASQTSVDVRYGHPYSLPIPAKLGYTFEGWYDGRLKIGNSGTWKYTSNKSLAAKWSIITYSIIYNLNGGAQNDSNPTSYTIDSGNLPLADPTKTGYTFMGWQYNGMNVTSVDPNWAKDVTLNALWNDGNEYVVALDADGGEASQTSVDVRYGHPYSLPIPAKLGYTFEGWYDGRLKIGNSGTWKYTSNKSLAAKWSIITYSITYNLNGGANAISNPTSYTVEDTISLANPSKNFNTFFGWYLNDKKIETIVLGTTGDLTIEAKWSQTDEQKAEEEKELRRLGGIPTLSDDGKTITYGLYPQKNVNDSSLVSTLNSLTTPESNGWYLYEGDYYAKLRATLRDGPSYKFDNGTTISSGATYWFKCEPIVWNVLSNNNGEYYIVSSVLLDEHCYDDSESNRTIDGQTIWPNNYKYSDIREWLNNDFYNSAFALGNSHIQTTMVDNSGFTTDNNGFACANTEDKIFLPSYKDYINSSYGFSTSTGSTDTRYCRTTDWVRARGTYYSVSNQYNGLYWTRSPSRSSSSAWSVYSDGCFLGEDSVSNVFICVRPGLSIKIA